MHENKKPQSTPKEQEHGRRLQGRLIVRRKKLLLFLLLLSFSFSLTGCILGGIARGIGAGVLGAGRLVGRGLLGLGRGAAWGAGRLWGGLQNVFGNGAGNLGLAGNGAFGQGVARAGNVGAAWGAPGMMGYPAAPQEGFAYLGAPAGGGARGRVMTQAQGLDRASLLSRQGRPEAALAVKGI